MVGHTGVEQVQSLYRGRVIALDNVVYETSRLGALLWEDSVFYRVLRTGQREVISR